MSQSPIDDFSPQATARYSQGWRALNRLLREGRSFSGHERHCAFLNTLGSDPSGQFANVSAVSGLDFAEDGRALVLSDWDFDGKLDVWIASRTAPRLRLMRNVMPTSNHFVAFRLEGDGRVTSRDAIGARVELTLRGESTRPLIKTLHAGDAFLSQSSSWIHFGLGENSDIEKVVIRWPGGKPLELRNLKVDQRYIVSQSAGAAEAWTPPGDRKELIAAAVEPAEADTFARTLLPTRLLLPNVSTHDEPSPLNARLQGATLITLWSATCGPCITELKELADHEDRLRAERLDVVAVNLDHLSAPADDANAILEGLGFPFRAEQGTEQLVRTLDLLQRSVFDLAQDLAVPTSFLFDASGRLAVIYRGPAPIDQVLADVPLLDKTGAELHNAATPFRGRWRSAPPATDPLRLVSQLLDRNLLDEGAAYLQQYADLFADSSESLSASDAGEIFYVLGVLRQSQGNVDAALDAFRRAQQLNPSDVRVRKDLSTLLARMGQIDAAADAMAEAAGIAPEDADSQRKLAMLRMAQRRFPEAIEGFERVVSKQPGDVTSQYNLANAYGAVGELRKAIERYELIIDRQPTMALAANNLAWIWATHPDESLRNGEQAVRLAMSICEQNENERFLDTLAAAQAELGQFEQAVASLSRAIALLEDNGVDVKQLQPMRDRLELYEQDQPYRDVDAFDRAEQ